VLLLVPTFHYSRLVIAALKQQKEKLSGNILVKWTQFNEASFFRFFFFLTSSSESYSSFIMSKSVLRVSSICLNNCDHTSSHASDEAANVVLTKFIPLPNDDAAQLLKSSVRLDAFVHAPLKSIP